MTRTIKFTKMHGAGNDYIYVDTTKFPISNPEELSRIWSAPHTGIGSDGLVLIGASDKADFSMRIFNADGSEARMCGNASRCIGKYLFDYGLTAKTEIMLDTLSGIKVLNLHLADGKVDSVTVDMGIPADEPADYDGKGAKPMKEQPIEADGARYVGTTVSMGNPHLVIFVNNVEDIDLPAIGPRLENHPLFPGRINVEFAQILGEGKSGCAFGNAVRASPKPAEPEHAPPPSQPSSPGVQGEIPQSSWTGENSTSDGTSPPNMS